MPNIFERMAAETQSAPKGNIFERMAEGKKAQRSASGVKKFTKEIARQRVQPLLGAAERFTFPAELAEPASREVLREVAEGDDFLIPEVAEASRKRAQSLVPTQRGLERSIEEKTGLPLTPKGGTDEIARLIGGIGRAPKPRAARPKPKVVQPEIQRSMPISEISEIERLPSGLTKPRAIGAQHAGKAILSPERQAKSIQKIDKEAAELAKKVVEKRLPQAEKIKAGHDFEAEFKEGFGRLRQSAEKANPVVDITDVGDYLKGARKKYVGIPREILPPDAKKILAESASLRNNPQTELKNLLRIYRFNNDKLSDIFETRHLKGSRKEYVDFLVGLNKSIVKAFERTLPEDSAWLKQFKDLNSTFKGYQNAQKTLNTLETVLGAEAKPSTIQKLATDQKTQKKLALSMGKEGADEIIQIAKDMKLARDAISGITAKSFKELDSIYPIGLLVPGIQIPSGFGLLKKSPGYLRRLYGWYLTTPSRRKAFDNALSALESGDKMSYQKATQALEKELPKLLEYKPSK